MRGNEVPSPLMLLRSALSPLLSYTWIANGRGLEHVEVKTNVIT